MNHNDLIEIKNEVEEINGKLDKALDKDRYAWMFPLGFISGMIAIAIALLQFL